jgi:hypothetical protein
LSHPRAQLVLAGLAVGVACTPLPDPRSSPPAPGQAAALQRVANPDARGVEDQPDWGAEAARLREELGPRLEAETQLAPAAACGAMLEAARIHYLGIEDAGVRDEVARVLDAVRSEDLAACTSTTSVLAARCVSLLLIEGRGELPYLLDQCERAFPRA